MKEEKIRLYLSKWLAENNYTNEWLKDLNLTSSNFRDMVENALRIGLDESVIIGLSIEEIQDIVICELIESISNHVSKQIDWNERFVFIHSSPHFKTKQYEFSLKELSLIDTKAESEISHPITIASIIGDLVNLHFRQDNASVRMFKAIEI